MESNSMKTRWIGAALSACLLLLGGVAQALPVCSPAYTISIASGVTLSANCTPDVGQSINFADGYLWYRDTVATGDTTGIITQTTGQANGSTYTVKAKNASSGYGDLGSVAVVASSPTPCSLNVLGGGASANVTAGSSVTLVPTCVGADSLDWYSKIDSGAYTHIISPPGGVVIPSGTSTKYYVVGSNDYGDTTSGEVTLNTVATLAGCSISPSSASKTVGGNTAQVFTVSCSSGSPSSYSWSGGGAGASGANTSSYTTGNSLSAATYPIAVTVSNGASTSTPSATLTVSNVTPPSGCAITPSSASKTAGGNTAQAFTASCSSGSPTSYAWSGTGTAGGAASGTNNNTFTTASSLAQGSYGVSFVASNAGGNGSTTSATLTVSNVTPPSGCAITPSSASKTAGGNTAQVFTASCSSGSPTSYAWSGTGTAGGAASGTNNNTFTTASSLAQGSYGVSFVASNAGGNGSTTSATLTVASSQVSGCNTSATMNRDWAWQTTSETISMVAGQTLAVKFRIPSSGKNGAFTTVETLVGGVPAERYATISTCPGDFSVSTASCFVDGTSLTASVKFYTGTVRYYCPLQPNTDYYFNIRHANPDPAGQYSNFTESCGAGKTCGFILQFGHN